MTKKADECFAHLSSVLVPVSMLNEIVERGYSVYNRYENGRYHIDSLKDISNVDIFSSGDVKAAIAFQELKDSE